ncbi:hypothetical protein QQ045_031029 [Rhodiola kirilowii]
MQPGVTSMKTPTVDSFFKRKLLKISEKDSHVHSEKHHAPKLQRLEIEDDFDINKLERDPGLQPQIWKYPTPLVSVMRFEELILILVRINLCLMSIQYLLKDNPAVFSHLGIVILHRGWNIPLQ